MADVLAVILGRAGSKGLPGKNALPLAGRPMVAWTIDDALAARCADRVLVSTDCPQVAAAAERAGVAVVDRPPELATDTARVAAAAAHAFRHDGARASVVIVLYANVPVRPEGLLDHAVDLLLAGGADSVQSYCDVGKYHPLWMMEIGEASRVRPYVANAAHRRQDLPALLIPDGGVIAVRAALLGATGDGDRPHAFLGADRRAIVNRRGAVIDVDDAADLAAAEAALSVARAGECLP